MSTVVCLKYDRDSEKWQVASFFCRLFLTSECQRLVYVYVFYFSTLSNKREKGGESVRFSLRPFVRFGFLQKEGKMSRTLQASQYSVRTCTIILEYLYCDKEPATIHWNNDFRRGCISTSSASPKIIRLFDYSISTARENLCIFLHLHFMGVTGRLTISVLSSCYW